MFDPSLRNGVVSAYYAITHPGEFQQYVTPEVVSNIFDTLSFVFVTPEFLGGDRKTRIAAATNRIAEAVIWVYNAKIFGLSLFRAFGVLVVINFFVVIGFFIPYDNAMLDQFYQVFGILFAVGALPLGFAIILQKIGEKAGFYAGVYLFVLARAIAIGTAVHGVGTGHPAE